LFQYTYGNFHFVDTSENKKVEASEAKHCYFLVEPKADRQQDEEDD
jgi:hypothetical protein